MILLASQSPRRAQLIEMTGLPYRIVRTEGVEEVWPGHLPPEQVAPFLSKLKASAYTDKISGDDVLLTADTVVISPDGKILGKPHDREDAQRMLRGLSGQRHRVVTGVTLKFADGASETFSNTSIVEFYPLSDSDIEYYLSNFAPTDKAGAYGIQEWIGVTSVKSIEGCFYNVMGLPASDIFQRLKSRGIGVR